MLQLTFNQFQDLKQNVTNWIRINHCQAWFGYEPTYKVYLIKSYDTIVAYEDKDTLYSLGRFTMTTYQHIRKYRNDYSKNKVYTKEKNLELVNWFK